MKRVLERHSQLSKREMPTVQPGEPRGYIQKQPIKENSKPKKAANKRKRQEGDSRASKKRKRQPKEKSGSKPKGRNASSKRKRKDACDRPKKKRKLPEP